MAWNDRAAASGIGIWCRSPGSRRRGNGKNPATLRSRITHSFHWEAEQELTEAIEFYEGREPGLGEDFALVIEEAIDRILRFPKASPEIWGDVRRCVVHRFPFGVVYAIRPDSIYILAVMHLNRDPEYWIHRQS